MSFQAPTGNKDIERFEVIIEGGCIEKNCTLVKSTSPLQCEFAELEPATRYAVNVRSCLPSTNGCSNNLTDLAITTPVGNALILDVFQSILMLNVIVYLSLC